MAQLITLKNQNGDYFVLRDDWQESDFQQVADDDWGVELTREQLEKAMRIAARTHDASIGINWEFISTCIEVVLEE